MLRWSLIFLVISLIAAALGYGGIAADSAEIAKILFFIFLAIFESCSVFSGALRSRQSCRNASEASEILSARSGKHGNPV